MVSIVNGKTKTTKDGWDKLEIIGKSFAGVLVSAAIAFYGFYSGEKQFQSSENNRKDQFKISEQNRKDQFRIAEENRKAQIIVQTIGNREAASADLKAKMFSALLSHYLKKQDDPVTQRAILELIGLNFQEHLRLKPLFEKLEKELSGNKKELKKLRSVAKNMARIEIDNIVGNGGSYCELELPYQKTITSGENCELPLSLTLLKVDESGIRVSMDGNDKDGFNVNYFDMPLVDNTRLGEYTYSIILSHTEDKPVKKASVKVVLLPKYFYSARHGLYFDQVLGDLTDPDNEE